MIFEWEGGLDEGWRSPPPPSIGPKQRTYMLMSLSFQVSYLICNQLTCVNDTQLFCSLHTIIFSEPKYCGL